ncbi:transient receptor potential cation channel subfamily A member 1-like [Ptychodera flava]|uniref:transient receptor potential cation channel subfamily A member 1-like n=1 Tax=Ptychodera flava TaxID=63121 RepID=UPI00396A4F37
MSIKLRRSFTMRTAGFITAIRSRRVAQDRKKKKSSSLADRRVSSASSIAGNLVNANDITLQEVQSSFNSFKGHFESDDVLLGLVNISQAAREGRVEIFQNDRRTPEELNSRDEDGLAPLHHAAHYDRTEVVEELILRGADINIRAEEDDVTPLHLAIKYRNLETVKLLMKYDAATYTRDRNGLTPLHLSARRGYEEITRILLVEGKADPNARDNDKLTPLHQAAIQGNLAVCRLLVEHGADCRAKEINDITPLMLAATEGHLEIIKLLMGTALMARISLVEYMSYADNEGNTALHLAVANGSIECAELFLEHRAFVDIRKGNLFTSLHIAAVGGYVDMADMLLKRGASINARDAEQMTPLHRAAMYDRVEMINFLLSKGAMIDSKDADNFTPLLCAAWKGQTQAASTLIHHGAKITSVDTEMKSCLHWAVGCSHLEFILMLLVNGGAVLMDFPDKNDQTPLHYAAELGYVQILKLFLDYGAKIDPRDRDEKTPLHLAAQCGRLQCMETLVLANPTQINEDDVEGRTPLLLASLEGHHSVVKSLLGLGAEITSRDDNHWSALALASSRGHIHTMAVLIDNHCEINVVDKNRNTPLHLSCANGHIEATEILLRKGADVTILNNGGYNCLDAAIENLQEGTAAAIIKHKSWKLALRHQDRKFRTPMKRLIEKLPRVALLAMDRCVSRSHVDREDPHLRVTYNYEFLDPGPDEMLTESSERYLALTTMVRYGREQLLSHELSQTLMALKWTTIARYVFYTAFIVHIIFMIGITSYAAISEHIVTTNLDDYGCPISNTTTTVKRNHDGLLTSIEFLVIFFVSLNVIKVALDLYTHRLRYFTKFTNFLLVTMLFTSCLFIAPPFSVPCAQAWTNGSIAIFLSWMTFLGYLQRFDVVGIYVVMFVAVLISLMKAVIVYSWFVVAFASVFYVMFARLEQFSTLGNAMLKTLVMTIGEFEYEDIFHDKPLDPFDSSSRILFSVFLFLMPIVLINLMIGISVGDIEGVRKTAFLRRLGMQVELISDIDKKMPFLLQRKLFVKEVMVQPNKEKMTRFRKVTRFFLGRSDNTEFVTLRDKDRDKTKVEELRQQLNKQKASFKVVFSMLQQQTEILTKISEKMNLDVEIDEPSPLHKARSTWSVMDL